MEKRTLTKDGYAQLQRKLSQLEGEQLQQAQRRVDEARAFCDFSEDPLYAEFVEQSQRIREEIEQLRYTLKHSHIIEPTNEDIAQIGSYVTIKECPNGEEEQYQLVTAIEADITQQKLSIESPLGRQLLNRQVGDVVAMEQWELQIVAIRASHESA